MTWVKLCGLRTEADVSAAVAAGADAVGFVTAERSVRRIAGDRVAELASGVTIERFLVTEDEEPDMVLATAKRAGMTGIQPHGEYALDTALVGLAEGLSVLYPISVADLYAGATPPAGAIPIYDGAVPGSGTGFDPGVLAGLAGPFVIAGGLTPQNVRSVIDTLSPYGVDVSSGIERTPGEKDPELMRRFVEAVR